MGDGDWKGHRTLTGHAGWVTAVAFSPDNRQIATGSRDAKVKLWDHGSGQLERTVEGGSDGYVMSVAFSPDGKWVAAANYAGTATVWESDSGRTVHEARNTANGTNWWVAFSPDGRFLLVAGGDDPRIKILDVSTWALARGFGGAGPDMVTTAALTADGRYLVAGDTDKTLRIWDPATGTLLRTIANDDHAVGSVAASPDGKHFVDDGLRIREIASGKIVRRIEARSPATSAVALSPDGTRIVSAGAPSIPVLWDANSGRAILRLEGDVANVKSLAFSHDGRRIAAGSYDAPIRIWDAVTGRLVRTIQDTDGIYAVAFSHDDKHLLAGGEGVANPAGGNAIKDVRVWDLATGKLIRSLKGHTEDVRSVAYSGDSSRIASGGWDFMVNVWDAKTGRQLRSFDHGRMVISVAISPDGRRVASGSTNTIIKLWDIASGKLIRELKDNHSVNSLRFSADGRQLLSGDSGNKARLWEVESGRPVRTFTGDFSSVSVALFSPDGRRIIIGSGNSSIRTIDAKTGTLISTMIAGSTSDWLTITPPGFFAGTLRAAEMLSVTRGLETRGIDQIWQSLYNPDLVREHLAGDPGREVAKASEVVNLEKVLMSGEPPGVEVAVPAGDGVGDGLVSIKARVADRGGGIGRIEWRVNGVTVGVEPAPAATGGPVDIDA